MFVIFFLFIVDEKKVNKTLAARVKLRARETVKVKLKKEGIYDYNFINLTIFFS